MSEQRDIAVLKLSSGLILNPDGVGINPEAVSMWSDQIAMVNQEFHPLIVLGGATGAGRDFLRRNRKSYEGVDAQSLAAYGTAAVSMAFQTELMSGYVIASGQVLVNHNQLKRPKSIVIQGILNGILEQGTVYNVNENDQETLFELKLLEEEEREVRAKKEGIDNDPLSAQITIALIEELKRRGLSQDMAVHLVMFTEVGGFKIDDEIQPTISASNEDEVYANCDGVGPTGSGGMEVKARAAFDAAKQGAKSVTIASPYQHWLDILNGHPEAGKATKVLQ